MGAAEKVATGPAQTYGPPPAGCVRRPRALGLPLAMRPILLSAFLALAACQSPGGGAFAAPSSAASTAALLDRVKAMAGEWTVEMPGSPSGTCVFAVSSGGSVVREIMFPGTEHEMTNLYHMDGDSLVLTHYCAGGNQPRMRAEAGDGTRLKFEFDSVTDRQQSEHCMGSMTLTIVDADHATADWCASDASGTSHVTSFQLTRKKT